MGTANERDKRLRESGFSWILTDQDHASIVLTGKAFPAKFEEFKTDCQSQWGDADEVLYLRYLLFKSWAENKSGIPKNYLEPNFMNAVFDPDQPSLGRRSAELRRAAFDMYGQHYAAYHADVKALAQAINKDQSLTQYSGQGGLARAADKALDEALEGNRVEDVLEAADRFLTQMWAGINARDELCDDIKINAAETAGCYTSGGTEGLILSPESGGKEGLQAFWQGVTGAVKNLKSFTEGEMPTEEARRLKKQVTFDGGQACADKVAATAEISKAQRALRTAAENLEELIQQDLTLLQARIPSGVTVLSGEDRDWVSNKWDTWGTKATLVQQADVAVFGAIRNLGKAMLAAANECVLWAIERTRGQLADGLMVENTWLWLALHGSKLTFAGVSAVLSFVPFGFMAAPVVSFAGFVANNAIMPSVKLFWTGVAAQNDEKIEELMGKEYVGQITKRMDEVKKRYVPKVVAGMPETVQDAAQGGGEQLGMMGDLGGLLAGVIPAGADAASHVPEAAGQGGALFGVVAGLAEMGWDIANYPSAELQVSPEKRQQMIEMYRLAQQHRRGGSGPLNMGNNVAVTVSGDRVTVVVNGAEYLIDANGKLVAANDAARARDAVRHIRKFVSVVDCVASGFGDRFEATDVQDGAWLVTVPWELVRGSVRTAAFTVRTVGDTESATVTGIQASGHPAHDPADRHKLTIDVTISDKCSTRACVRAHVSTVGPAYDDKVVDRWAARATRRMVRSEAGWEPVVQNEQSALSRILTAKVRRAKQEV